MTNKLTDLNDHLFAQLERLGQENLSPEDIDKEIKRTDAIVAVSEQIVNNANISLKAASLVAEYGGGYEKILPMLAEKTEAKE